jgi:hypothetical protein
MDTIRKELLVEWSDELRLMNLLRDSLLSAGIDASNTIIVTVSTDYSSVIGQYLRHQLTKDGEICDGFGIDVPYPDQTFNGRFIQELCEMFRIHLDSIAEKNILLVEAGIIRGGNYTKVVDIIKNTLEIKLPIITLAMYENIHSIYKSDFVGEFYDDKTQDLTFWWEKENNHWAN